MGNIKILNPRVANQIAAGEVVERPASVVKELVDNAVDSGGDEIEIRIEKGGIGKIEVSDNGVGMDEEDLELSTVRYATSKLNLIEDLVALKSYGFRGEALASIAAVSKMEIKSKTENEESGHLIYIEGGELVRRGKVGRGRGTTVSVREIFFNVPVRKKFLRSENTEWRSVLVMVENLGLAMRGVGVRMWHDDKLVLDLNRHDNLINRVTKVFGMLKQDLMEVRYEHPHLKIAGYVAKVDRARERGVRQVLVVNGRVVVDRGVMRSFKEALGTLLPVRYQVPWYLEIIINGELVDINVHPRKEEVRFVNPYFVYNAITKAIRDVVTKNDLTFVRGERSEEEFINDEQNKVWPSEKSGGSNYERRGVSLEVNKILQPEMFSKTEIVDKSSKFVQINNLYLVGESDEGMVMIDQHAAHERIRYEQLMAGEERGAGRDLLIEQEMSLNSQEREVLWDKKGVLEEVGIRLKMEEGKLYLVGVPVGWEGVNLSKALSEVAGDLIEGGKFREISDDRKRMLTYLSCRSAIKGGQRMTDWEILKLVEELDKCRLPYTCPHGRPVKIVIPWKEIEKMFLRVM